MRPALIDAWKGLAGFRGEASLRTWLFTTARRRAYAHYRKFPSSGSRPYVDIAEVADQLPAGNANPAGRQLGHDLLSALDMALRTLPPRQRSVWILREIEDFSYSQIATVMAITPDAVRGLLERARTTLAISLKEWR